MLELGDEHRRHAVERRAPLLLYCFHRENRIESLCRYDHGRAVCGARQVAEHHPEAVIERHRDADAILLAVLQRLPDEETVVEDGVMGEGCTLGKSCGA